MSSGNGSCFSLAESFSLCTFSRLCVLSLLQVVMHTQKLKEELASMTAEKEELERNIEQFRQEMHQMSTESAQQAEARMHDLEKSHMSAAEALENMCALTPRCCRVCALRGLLAAMRFFY